MRSDMNLKYEKSSVNINGNNDICERVVSGVACAALDTVRRIIATDFTEQAEDTEDEGDLFVDAQDIMVAS